MVVFPAIWLFMLHKHARLTHRGSVSPCNAPVQWAFAAPVMMMMVGGVLLFWVG